MRFSRPCGRVNQLNAFHKKMVKLGREGLLIARQAGKILKFERERCKKKGHAVWRKFLLENLPYDERTARNYIAVDDDWEVIQAHWDTIEGLADAYKFTTATAKKSHLNQPKSSAPRRRPIPSQNPNSAPVLMNNRTKSARRATNVPTAGRSLTASTTQ